MAKYKGLFSPQGTTQTFTGFLITRLIIFAVFLATAIAAFCLSIPTLAGNGSYQETKYTITSVEPGTGIYENYKKYSAKYEYNNTEYIITTYDKKDIAVGTEQTIYVYKKDPTTYLTEKPSLVLPILEFAMGAVMAGTVIYIAVMMPIGIINYKKEN